MQFAEKPLTEVRLVPAMRDTQQKVGRQTLTDSQPLVWHVTALKALLTTVGANILLSTDLIWVQLALVHWVGVLNDFYLVFSKSLPIEPLRRNNTGPH